jgi:UDP-N-acetylglucosamine acyltransferase
VRIGQGAIIGGMSGVDRDVIPYGAVKGERAHLYDINIIGLRRSGIARHEINVLKQAYDMIFFGNDTLAQNLKNAEESIKGSEIVDRLIEFMKRERETETDRAFCFPKKDFVIKK